MTKRLVAIMSGAVLALATAFSGVAYAQHHVTKHHAVHHSKAGKHATASESEETGTEESTEEGLGDGPGGHEDPPGEVDHQFEGAE
jgi:hypothetical protein